MRTTRREILQLSLAGIGTALVPVSLPAASCTLRTTLDQVSDLLLRHLPETAVYNGDPAALDGGPLARRLDDWSPAGIEAYRGAFAYAAQLLARADYGGR